MPVRAVAAGNLYDSPPCVVAAGYRVGAALFWLAAILPSQSSSQLPSGTRRTARYSPGGRNALPAISPRSLMKVTKVIFRVEWGDTRLFKSTMGAAIFPKKCVQVFPATRRCASNLTF